jgi:HAMP domain-containing protein
VRRALGSVRARATLGATLVVAVALVAAGTAVLLSLWSNLSGQASTQAERTARAVAADLAAGTAYDKLSLDDDDRPVQVVDPAGRLVAASEDLERIRGTGVEAVRPQAAVDTDGTGQEEQEEGDDSLSPGEIDDDVSFTDGSATVDGDEADYRFAAVHVEADGKGTLTVYAGAPLSAEQSAVSTALTVDADRACRCCWRSSRVTWLVTRRALRPVEGIRPRDGRPSWPSDLSRRVPVPDAHDEVGRLARTTNETLAALEASVEQQRRFVADASHELRSPIASLRTQLEVGAAHPELLDVRRGRGHRTAAAPRRRSAAARPP